MNQYSLFETYLYINYIIINLITLKYIYYAWRSVKYSLEGSQNNILNGNPDKTFLDKIF